MATEMYKVESFDWMVQFYLPKIEFRNGVLFLDFDCVLRVGRIFQECWGFGICLFGFGFGFCKPITERGRLRWMQDHFWFHPSMK